MLPRRYVVEVQNDHIVVRFTATSYIMSYNRVTYAPWLLPSKGPSQDDHRKKAPTEADALLCNRIGAYGVLSPVVGDSVLGWFTVTSTPFWSD